MHLHDLDMGPGVFVVEHHGTGKLILIKRLNNSADNIQDRPANCTPPILDTGTARADCSISSKTAYRQQRRSPTATTACVRCTTSITRSRRWAKSGAMSPARSS